MKGVLIGTDFIKSSNGDYKVIETNTNIRLYENEDLSINDYIDKVSFKNLLIQNNITELVYIHPGNAGDANSQRRQEKSIFENIANELNITYTKVITPPSSVTIPYVEDSDNKFILRHSYDSTALIDDTYCNDNYEFAKLIEGQSYSTKKIIKDSNFNLNDFPSVDISTNYPNVVVKSRYPNYNTVEFPKIFKLDSDSELEILANITQSTETYVEEYIISNDELIDNSVNIIRSVDIIYGSNLDTLHLGSHHIISRLEIDLTDDVYNENKEINQIGRVRYSTKNSMNIFSTNVIYHADQDSKIRLADGTTTNIANLSVGSVVTSPTFENFDSIDDDGPNYKNWSGSFDNSKSTLQLREATVVSLNSKTLDTVFIEITLEDGTNWSDLPSSPAYVEIKDSLLTKFKTIDELTIGDKFILYNSNTNELEKVAVTDLNVIFKTNFTIYQIDIEPFNLFISSIDEANNRYMVMHNYGCSSCYGWPANCGYTYCAFFCYFCSKSDISYKENLNLIGESPLGIKIYQFNYIGETGLYEGVIAQELIGTKYESALQLDDNGKYLVDYGKIDVEFKKIN
jgi:hypothetical protein